MDQIQYRMKSTIASFYVVASNEGLQGIYFDKQPIKTVTKLDTSKPSQKIIAQAVKELEEYLNSKRQRFNVTVNLSGTAFQKKVWNALSKIPFGTTVSYKDIAKSIKNPKAVRAVGSANGKNPFCVVIPCHRVIAADGSIGGYSGGLPIKEKLLKLEGISLR